MRKWLNELLLKWANKIHKKILHRIENDWDHVENIYNIIQTSFDGDNKLDYIVKYDNISDHFVIDIWNMYGDKGVLNHLTISRQTISMLKTLIRDKKIKKLVDS